MHQRSTPSPVLAALFVLLIGCTTGASTSSGAVAHGPRVSRSASASPHIKHRHAKQVHTTTAPSPTGLHDHHPSIPAADFPRHSLTPGVALTVTRARVCTPGYASGARDVSDAEKADVYDRYGITWVPYHHEIDHLISLELGGSNAIQNLWPEPYAGRWGARTKDVLENRLHELVCDGRLSLASAQQQEARDWVAAYRKYVGGPPGGGSTSGGSSVGGYYASSYPTASTIYCADDSAWHELSKTYLVHFATYEQAKARFPSYHLHQPC
jgi:hypothetical protein